MLDTYDYITIFILGSVGGFTSGFLGVGGGIIYLPILDYFLSRMGMTNDMLAKGMIANSLFTIIFSGSVASYKQYRMGNFYPTEILQTVIPGLVTAIACTYAIKAGDWYSKSVFNYVFATLLLFILLRMFFAKPPAMQSNEHVAKASSYGAVGFFAGIVTAMSGLGGGVVMTPMFTDILKQNIRKASSISNGVIPLFAIMIGIYNLSDPAPTRIHEWQVGYIVMPVILPLIAAAIVFAPVGVKQAQKANPQLIRIVFAIFVSAVFIQRLYEIFSS